MAGTTPTAQGQSSSSSSGSGQTVGTISPTSLQPTYLTSLFPNGIPQASTTGYSAAQTANAPSSSAITSAIMQSLQPQFQQQDSALQESLADAGIIGGSTTGAVGALGQQQQTQALGSIAPYIMQGYQMQQTDNLANQSADNAADQYNASAFNAGGQFNTGNLINTGEYDSSLGASQADYLAGLQNQDYLTQLGMQGNLIDQSAGAQTGAYQPIYQQPSAPNFAGLGSAVAPTATSTNTGSAQNGFAYDPGQYDTGSESAGDY